ncbi:hypothetical protein N7474_002386 [Penicillium riverlandense]|uniref:uncharacterized protein n=1 Tax=Penicillium riverlandense TaxID=1903569 RepID=UPI002547601A|nr:uncharacterized protein N7474_002386 [Penicillium riverlandense]KAJ5825248.1 hypothetical protein N7474_002386 [Penicillium riverlandense]
MTRQVQFLPTTLSLLTIVTQLSRPQWPDRNPQNANPPPPNASNASRKRAKTFDARTLAVQSADAALSATGELDVAAYAAARAFEINALEEGMQRSRSVLTTRAFQKVPRALRRRTASHNVKRDNTPTVTARRRKPTQLMRLRLESARRLQNLNARTKARRAAAKAKRTQSEQTALKEAGSHPFEIAPRVPKIKKNKLSRPPPAEAKYRKRQRCKTWLPTHMFHAKRAHMATSKDPVWRFALPLSPTEKSYRPTHRARGARGAVAWDMSYMSTIQLEGTGDAIEAVLRVMGIDGDEALGVKGRKWRAGTRALQAWMFEKECRVRPIAPVALIWCARPRSEDVEMGDVGKPKKDRSKLWIRVHPSAFLQLWNELLEVSKRQNPVVMVEDLRFEIGSIEITGPGSTEALLAALQPIRGSDGNAATLQSPEDTWPALLGVSNPSSLPQNALLSFMVSDPRLHFPPRTLRPRENDESHMNDLATLLASWPPDQTQGPSPIFDRSTRLTAARQLPSQKAINRRRALAGPGNYPPPQPSDPQIPIMAIATRPQSRNNQRSNAPGSWTILLPWKCVTPVWYSLMYYPLSSGGNPRFGGLKEQQQLAFEAGEPWFPGDFPGTRAGWEWGLRETERTRVEWERRPKGRRHEFDSLVLGAGHPKGEIGRGWACDWERLLRGGPPQVGDGSADKDMDKDKDSNGANTVIPPLDMHNLRCFPSEINQFITKKSDPSALVTVHITLSTRGTPTPRARIYRLPSDPVLRQKWLDLASPSARGSARPRPRHQKPTNKNTSPEETRRQLIESLIYPSAESDAEHLDVPPEADLIGFVTTGNYNLSEGKGTGVGCILLERVVGTNAKMSEKKMCIVRAAGEKVGRLGIWEVV